MNAEPEQVAAYVAAVEYGPDWRFTTTMAATQDPRMPINSPDMLLQVRWRVADIHGDGVGHTYLTGVQPLLLSVWGSDWMQLLDWTIHDAIAELEAHERLERLKVGGVPMWDAHHGGVFRSRPDGGAWHGLRQQQGIA